MVAGGGTRYDLAVSTQSDVSAGNLSSARQGALLCGWLAQRVRLSRVSSVPFTTCLLISQVVLSHFQLMGLAGFLRCNWSTDLDNLFLLARATVFPIEALPTSFSCLIQDDASNALDSDAYGTVSVFPFT